MSPVDASHDHSYTTGSLNTQHGPGARPSETALIIINIPFALDYCRVVMTLCDVIRQLYKRLGALVGSSNIGPSAPLDTLPPHGSGHGVNSRSGESSVPWPPGLTDLITKADQKLKVRYPPVFRNQSQWLIRSPSTETLARVRSRYGTDRSNRGQPTTGIPHSQSQCDTESCPHIQRFNARRGSEPGVEFSA
jgi:hypothetical protein